MMEEDEDYERLAFDNQAGLEGQEKLTFHLERVALGMGTIYDARELAAALGLSTELRRAVG